MHLNSTRSMRSILLSALLPAVTCGSASAQNSADIPLRIQRAQAAPTTSVNPGAVTAKPAAVAATTAKPAATASATPAKPPATASAAGRPGAAALERGRYFSRHGAYSDAFNFFNKAAEADPKNPEAYNRRARVEWQLEKNDEALEDVRYAIKLNPDYAEAFCTRAAILNSTGNYHDAIVDTALAVDLKPKLKEAYTIQASAYRNLKQYREADELMQKLASIQGAVSAFDEWAPEIDYTQYISDLQSRVRQRFQPPVAVFPPIVVLFKLHRNGQITEARVNTPGIATADNAAVEAAKAAAPFNQPPAGSPPDFDVFVVLDPPAQDSSPPVADAPAAATQAQAAAPASSSPKAGINWGRVTSTGLNTGLTLMRFVHF